MNKEKLYIQKRKAKAFLTGQYGFIYADDMEEYIADRGKLMFTPQEIPFSIARSNEELEDNIKNFDKDKYALCVKDFINRVGIIEDGKASKRVGDLIEDRS